MRGRNRLEICQTTAPELLGGKKSATALTHEYMLGGMEAERTGIGEYLTRFVAQMRKVPTGSTLTRNCVFLDVVINMPAHKRADASEGVM